MLPAEPKAEVGNTYRDLDYLGYHKNLANLIIILLSLHCFEENNDKHKEPELILLLEIMHCARNLQTSKLSASR